MASLIGGWHAVSNCSIDGSLSVIIASIFTDLIYTRFLENSLLFGQVIFCLESNFALFNLLWNLPLYLSAMTSL